MFVIVSERTKIIGIKKAIGAKRKNILYEVLAEAILICLMGGFFGLILVYLLTLIFTHYFSLPVFISIPMLFATIIICFVVGIVSGLFPAYKAARMNAVEAIRK